MRWLPLFLFAGAAWAQNFSVGIRGGAPLNEFFDAASTRFRTVPHHYVVGPAFEVRLPAGLGLGLDALFQRVEFNDGTRNQTGIVWNFPLMLRKRFGKPKAGVKPFIAGGVNINRLSGLAISDPGAFFKSSTTGLVVGTGLELKAAFLKLTPEVRYHHQWEDNFKLSNLFGSGRNHMMVLLGITF